MVAKAAAKSLEKALSSWSGGTSTTFKEQEIIPHLYITLESKCDENQDLPIENLMRFLAEDIHHIYSHISSLESEAVFCVRNFEIWLTKLGCHSILWKVLKAHRYEESDLVKTVFSGLNKSPVKGLFLTEIMNCFYEDL